MAPYYFQESIRPKMVRHVMILLRRERRIKSGQSTECHSPSPSMLVQGQTPQTSRGVRVGLVQDPSVHSGIHLVLQKLIKGIVRTPSSPSLLFFSQSRRSLANRTFDCRFRSHLLFSRRLLIHFAFHGKNPLQPSK